MTDIDPAELGRWNLGIIRARLAYEGLHECRCGQWTRAHLCPRCMQLWKAERARKDTERRRAKRGAS